MKFRRVLQGDALDEHILAVSDAYEMCAHALLGLVGVGDVGLMLQIKGVPQRTVLHDGSSHGHKLAPLGAADLATLDGAPPFAIAVDGAFACDADVLTLAGRDERGSAVFLGSRLAVGLQMLASVGCGHDDGMALQMQVHVVFQRDEPSHIDAGRHHQMTSTFIINSADSLSEGFCVVSHTVAFATKVGDRHLIFWNLG